MRASEKSKGRRRPRGAVRPSQPDYPFTSKLPDGRTLFLSVPGRWVRQVRGHGPAFLPEAVRLIDRAVALAGGRRPASAPSPGYLATLRQALGLTQRELGSRIGVDAMTVSRWERGTVRPGAASLAAIEALRREAVRKGVVLAG